MGMGVHLLVRLNQVGIAVTYFLLNVHKLVAMESYLVLKNVMTRTLSMMMDVHQSVNLNLDFSVTLANLQFVKRSVETV